MKRSAYLASVNQYSCASSADEVCVRTLELHVSRVAAEESHNAIRDAFVDIREQRQLASLRREIVGPKTGRVKPLGLSSRRSHYYGAKQ